ncbi:uncharacterized protein ARMOST_21038 [Armillaria ostoyae]|uniref:Uncharacterized protein n=1 Tax=Armillaria ostoyae TaxID=47428 RepID=A0A284S942_ARMOS|nr:uncharacterized protein ARMOST_21038 [Armillaria ostoyae]
MCYRRRVIGPAISSAGVLMCVRYVTDDVLLDKLSFYVLFERRHVIGQARPSSLFTSCFWNHRDGVYSPPKSWLGMCK